MRKYYINYGDFNNTYDLCSVESESDKSALAKLGGEWERITLREARAKIRAEKDRRKSDAAFSGYGASEILPASEIYKQRMY